MKKISKKQQYICDNCSKEFIAYPKHRRAELKFCSVSCKAKFLRGGQFQKGEQHPLWRGGLSNKQGYLWNWKYVKPKILKRDNYSCVWCGQKGGKLNADHIKPFALFPELRLAIDNGRTLCITCHKKTDTYALKIK